MFKHGRVLKLIDGAFGNCDKPTQFCDPTHCEECAEHNALLCGRDRESLSIADIGNPGWDPLCFSSPQGVAYYFPKLARFALEPPVYGYGWYAGQLLFHLTSGYEQNAFFKYCSAEQRAAVSELLGTLIVAFAAEAATWSIEDDLARAHTLWAES